jgi:beta-lactam-binding protein with PASTA domain
MKQNSDWKSSKWAFILYNLAAAGIVLLCIVLGVMLFLNKYTRHGVEIVVPEVTGLYLEEAKAIIEAEGLNFFVTDTTYSNKTPLGTLVEQDPRAGSKVKPGRVVYVIHNAYARKPIALPNLQDLSLRQAERTLQSLEIKVANVTYVPSTFKDIVIEVRKGEQKVMVGSHLEEGDSITLIVGNGESESKVSTPNIIGCSLAEATAKLRNNSLGLGFVEYDVEPTEENEGNYIVYSQSPKSGTIIDAGTPVGVKLSTNRGKAVTANKEDEEEFF